MFYLIDKNTGMPALDNVMTNYMKCSIMISGPRVKFFVTYKRNERTLNIFQKKYSHEFKIPIILDNFEGSMGLELPSVNMLLITQFDRVMVMNSETYKMQDKFPINLMTSIEREPNQIISMAASQNEEWVAVISGKILVNDTQKAN